MKLRRPTPPDAPISLVPMIDVLLILLVFFMVTSTYLDLDMIPTAHRPPETATTAPAGPALPQATLLIRLAADGSPVVGGRSTAPEALAKMVRARVAAAPAIQVVVLPSGAASTQSLVDLMDLLAAAGAGRIRLVRLEARP